MSIPKEMKAVVFQGPFDVKTEVRPTPTITSPYDAIVKVTYSGLCGSDMHLYRGNIKLASGQIVGHEFIGTVVEVGELVKHFKAGDYVLSTFTIQCGKCFYCTHGYTGQCDVTNTFGKAGLDGGQAQYVKVPYADQTLFKKPVSKDHIDDSVYVLMADIFVTGYYGIKKIVDNLKIEQARGLGLQKFEDVTILQLGCGPVGLCALKIATHMGFKNVVVVDNVPSRLAQALKFGALKVINFEDDKNGVEEYVKTLPSGGFDAVLEVVGTPAALKTAYDSVRRNGFISSLGMAHGPLPFDGLECYLKNINISFGRCHVKALFEEALELFEQLKPSFAHFIDHKVPLDEATDAFKLFDHHKVNKVVFDCTK